MPDTITEPVTVTVTSNQGAGPLTATSAINTPPVTSEVVATPTPTPTPTPVAPQPVKPVETPKPSVQRVAGQPQQFKDTFVDKTVVKPDPTPASQFPKPPQTTAGLGVVKPTSKQIEENQANYKQSLAKHPQTLVDSYVEKEVPVEVVKPSIPRNPNIKVVDIREEFYCIRCGIKIPIKQECSVTIGDPVTKGLKQYRGMCFGCKEEMTALQRGPRQTGTGA